MGRPGRDRGDSSLSRFRPIQGVMDRRRRKDQGGRFPEMDPALDPKVAELLERLRKAEDRKEKVKLLKELIAKDGYLTDEMLEVAFARLVARLTEAK